MPKKKNNSPISIDKKKGYRRTRSKSQHKNMHVKPNIVPLKCVDKGLNRRRQNKLNQRKRKMEHQPGESFRPSKRLAQRKNTRDKQHNNQPDESMPKKIEIVNVREPVRSSNRIQARKDKQILQPSVGLGKQLFIRHLNYINH